MLNQPQGMLCKVSYWDGTSTNLFYRSWLLARIENPGEEKTDFGCDNRDLIGIRSPWPIHGERRSRSVRPVQRQGLRFRETGSGMGGTGIDANVLTYLVDAMSTGYDPRADPVLELAPQREAAYRILIYHEQFWVLPTAVEEAAAIKDLTVKEFHEHVQWALLGELMDLRYDGARVEELTQWHCGVNDCRIVSEAEVAGLDRLLSFDGKLIRHLGPHAKVEILTPSDYWASLGVAHCAKLRIRPDPGNPLSMVNWWKW
jgi:hypothetical protein